LELKAVDYLVVEHENQLINYLKATDKEIGLLLNFGAKPEIRRKAFDNERKICVNPDCAGFVFNEYIRMLIFNYQSIEHRNGRLSRKLKLRPIL
jgi:hypothetical protein